MTAKNSTTDAELIATLDAVNDHGSEQKAAISLGMPRSTVQARVQTARARGLKCSADKTPEAITQRERIAAQDRIRDLEAQIKTMHRDDLTAERVRESIFGLAKGPAQPPRWLIDPKPGHGITGVPCVLWSDWHWGEVVDPEQVNGINEYNLAIAHQRIRKLVDRTIDLCFNHMTKPRYPGVVVNLGGDMISGEIHEELTETNELPSMPLVLDLFGKLAWALGVMADKFGLVFVPGAVGNHGRTTRKPRMKNRVYSNFDWLLYQMLETHFKAAKDDRIQFLSPTGTDVNYSVFGHRYMLTHGDALGVKGGDGIIGALGPILRGTFKTANAANAINEPFDTILMGHWHQYIALRGLIVNGSLKGYDEFAKAMRFRPDFPEQALWFTHPTHGITCQWPVRLGNLKDKTDAPWVSFPKRAA